MKHSTFLSIGILTLLLGLATLSANAATPAVSPSQKTLKATGDNSMLGAKKLNDGILSNKNDSYGWCMAVHQQNNGDYLWLGANRDLGGLVALSSAQDIQTALAMVQMFGLTFDPTDQAGKIYRMSLEGDEQPWELMYENPVINGWRKMVVFKGDLYVFAGITNRMNFQTGQPIPANNWSAVFRFGSDFKYGDQPEIVLWETLPGTTIEYYRSGTITKNAQDQDEYLYIGTASGKIWRTDGTELKALTVGGSERNTGWELIVDLIDDGYIDAENEIAMIWDLIDFNGSIYAFVAAFAANVSEGFEVFKLTPNNNAHDITSIVGKNGVYQSGLGIRQHVAASPFKITVDDQDFVYVTTFANGPKFLASLIQLDIVAAFREVYMPATMYRFDANDNWEVVVGDQNMALKNDGSLVPFADGADERAGFSLGSSIVPNGSSNQYIWWMEQHEGRIYASTWDMGNFRESLAMGLAYLTSQTLDGGLIEAIEGVNDAITNLVTNIVTGTTEIINIAGEVADAIQEDLAQLMEGILQLPGTENPSEALTALLQAFAQNVMETLQEIANEYGATMEDLFDLEAITELVEAIGNFTEAIENFTEAGNVDQAMLILAATMASSLYLADNTNPVGFDLFVSDDGVTWEPVTVSGFGDAQNYGGRVILSTDYGLFLTTANPFSGFDIFKIEEFTTEMQVLTAEPTTPVELTVGGTYKFQVQTVFFDNTPTIAASADISSVNVTSEIISEKTVTDVFISQVDVVFDITAYGGRRFVETELELITGIHEITLTFTEAFTGEVKVTANADDLQIVFALNVAVANEAGVRDLMSENAMVIYPNPVTNGVLFVETNDKYQHIEIHDLLGRRVHIQSITGTKTEINMSHLQAGTYILRVGNRVATVVKR